MSFWKSLLKRFGWRFESAVTTSSVSPLTETKFTEKRIRRSDVVRWNPHYAEYFSSKVKDNTASPMCGLPSRMLTEVVEDFESGDIIIRYKVA